MISYKFKVFVIKLKTLLWNMKIFHNELPSVEYTNFFFINITTISILTVKSAKK